MNTFFQNRIYLLKGQKRASWSFSALSFFCKLACDSQVQDLVDFYRKHFQPLHRLVFEGDAPVLDRALSHRLIQGLVLDRAPRMMVSLSISGQLHSHCRSLKASLRLPLCGMRVLSPMLMLLPFLLSLSSQAALPALESVVTISNKHETCISVTKSRRGGL